MKYVKELDAIRTLISEAAEYAGPEDGETNYRIWDAIDDAEAAVKVLESALEYLDER